MRVVYHIGIYFYGILISVASLFNAKAKKRFLGQQQVFSQLKSFLEKRDNNFLVWFHAASLGEFEQGRPIMERLREKHPEYTILLTFFSPSGYELRKNYNGADWVCYLPLDTARNAKRFVELVNPAKVIFIKYEFWPNFLSYCKKKQIPTYIVSASFRESQLFFKWYGFPYAKLLKAFDIIFVQDEQSRALLDTIQVNNVVVAGDTRFDRVAQIAENHKPLPLLQRFKNKHKLIVVGSSWPKDEELLCVYINETETGKFVIAPHEIHESHLAQIEANISVPTVRFSQATPEAFDTARCLLIDNIGMLSSIYKYADIAYIGGGFGVGIHNVLEAAVYNIPVVFGPNCQKFKEARDLIKLGGGFAVSDFVELQSTLDWLLLHPDAGTIAGGYTQQQKGATAKIIQAIFN